MKNLLGLLLVFSFSLTVLAKDTEKLIVPKKFNGLSELKLSVTETIYNPASGENTPWQHVPTKTISFPLAKVQYEVVQFATSLLTESVMRSPVHNALGTLDEAKKTLKLLQNGLFDMLRGILNPRNGAFFDGLFGVTSGVINSANIAGGVVKTGASLVAYPVFRIAGGSASKRASLPGKRAAIIQIDTGFYPMDVLLDPYGDQIIRHHMNGVADYYCVDSGMEGNLSQCIDNIPYDIEYVDFVALTHSGGDYSNKYAAKKVLNRGHKVGLMVSIGCNDDASEMVLKENTMGQEGLSWGVHFYLSHAIAKRLRGIPMEEAAREAFIEDLPINFINPVSILGQIGVYGMGASNGIMGSYPDVRAEDTDEIKSRVAADMEKANTIRVLRYAQLYNDGKISISEFGKLVDVYGLSKNEIIGNTQKFQFSGSTFFMEQSFESLVENLEMTRFPVKVKYKVKRPGSRIKVTRYKYI
jgi:hypothetical protein